MKVLVIGHSYVKGLQRLGNWNIAKTLEDGNKALLDFHSISCHGKDFAHFCNHPDEFEAVKKLDPDVAIVILGGNSIVDSVSNGEIKALAHDFYSKLNEVVRPECLRLAVQIENRFVEEGNRFGTPSASEFNQRRHVINNFYNKSLKKHKLVNNVILLGKLKFLNDPKFFDNRVHLRREYMFGYKEVIINGLVYALEHRQ